MSNGRPLAKRLRDLDGAETFIPDFVDEVDAILGGNRNLIRREELLDKGAREIDLILGSRQINGIQSPYLGYFGESACALRSGEGFPG